MLKMNRKLKDAVYGFAVGDALGVPYEFKKRGTFECTGMIGGGTWSQKPGTWSDDTSLLLATCDSIREKQGIDADDMRKRFEDWCTCGKYTARGEWFDIGDTTARALFLGHGLGDYTSNGNGSLMRILPLAFTFCTDSDIYEVSAITHGHDISKLACRKYVLIVRGVIIGLPLERILLALRYVSDNIAFQRLISILNCNESNIKSSGYVVDTLEAAVWCFGTSKSYSEAVLKAVNLGGDTDTIAALTGGLAGIKWGFESIPKEWVNQLANKELIDSCLF